MYVPVCMMWYSRVVVGRLGGCNLQDNPSSGMLAQAALSEVLASGRGRSKTAAHQGFVVVKTSLQRQARSAAEEGVPPTVHIVCQP